MPKKSTRSTTNLANGKPIGRGLYNEPLRLAPVPRYIPRPRAHKHTPSVRNVFFLSNQTTRCDGKKTVHGRRRIPIPRLFLKCVLITFDRIPRGYIHSRTVYTVSPGRAFRRVAIVVGVVVVVAAVVVK